MLCDICHENEAVFHFKEIIGSEKKELNLCGECAARHHLQLDGDSPQELSAILAKLGTLIGNPGLAAAAASLNTEADQPGSEAPATPVCPGCGWTPRKFRETGRFGCEQCYSVFESELRDLLPRLHRGTEHTGRHPGGISPAAAARLAIVGLRRRLDAAVRAEDYEQAARLRDQLRQLSAAEEAAN